jgi:hypothetical protein
MNGFDAGRRVAAEAMAVMPSGASQRDCGRPGVEFSGTGDKGGHDMPARTAMRIWIFLLAVAGALVMLQPALAHHGWGWATDEEFAITGKITKVRLGNPHGEVTIDVDGASWLIEVGQPWRNERAGLTSEMLSVGRQITVHGHRSARAGERLVKAERIVIDGNSHNLYPDRPS